MPSALALSPAAPRPQPAPQPPVTLGSWQRPRS